MNAQKKAKAGRPPKSPEMKQHQRSIRLTASEWALVEAGAAELRRSQAWIVSECVRASLSTVIDQDRGALLNKLHSQTAVQASIEALQAGAVAVWRPFHTAPKDGSWITALMKEENRNCRWGHMQVIRWDDEYESWSQIGTNYESDTFAYWVPLPPTPAKEMS